MTDTEPSVSTVLRDLQRILFFRIILAVIVRLAVMAIGSPSGIKATATLTQSTMSFGTLIQFGYARFSQAALYSGHMSVVSLGNGSDGIRKGERTRR